VIFAEHQDGALGGVRTLFRCHGMKAGLEAVERAFEIYEDAGHPILFRTNRTDVTDIQSMGTGILFLESIIYASILARLNARGSYIVGNGFGWSTIISALVAGHTLSIDPDNDLNAFTNDLLTGHNLNGRALAGMSPKDVTEFPEDLDVVFIDGAHNNEQVLLDYHATKKGAHKDTLFLFHDVRYHNLGEAVDKTQGPVKREMNIESGMGLSTSEETYDQIRGLVEPFL